MPNEAHKRVQVAIKDILAELSETERALLSAVVRLERENLHLKTPNLKSDLLKKVETIIK